MFINYLRSVGHKSDSVYHAVDAYGEKSLSPYHLEGFSKEIQQAYYYMFPTYEEVHASIRRFTYSNVLIRVYSLWSENIKL